MKRIIFIFVAVVALLCVNNSVYAAYDTDFKVNKVEYINHDAYTDTIYYVTINNIDYKISSVFSTETVNVLKNVNKIYAITLFKENEV